MTSEAVAYKWFTSSGYTRGNSIPRSVFFYFFCIFLFFSTRVSSRDPRCSIGSIISWMDMYEVFPPEEFNSITFLPNRYVIVSSNHISYEYSYPISSEISLAVAALQLKIIAKARGCALILALCMVRVLRFLKSELS